MQKETEHHYGSIDARLAGWISSSPPSLVGYQLRCGASLPEPRERPQGRGEDWQPRAVTAILRACYGKGLKRPQLEAVEIAALSVLPEPEADDEDAGTPRAFSAHARWEHAVEKVSKYAHRILSHGPASGDAGGEILFSGGVLEARVLGLTLEQRVDLLWRRPDGNLEAVLVLPDDTTPNEPTARGGTVTTLGTSPGVALSSDWRCVLAAAIVADVYGETPDLHLVLVEPGIARVGRVSPKAAAERISGLAKTLEEARRSEGFVEEPETGEGAVYPLDPDMLEPSGGWRGPVRRPTFGPGPPPDRRRKL